MPKHSLNEVTEKDSSALPPKKIVKENAFDDFLFEDLGNIDALLDDTLELIDNWQNDSSANVSGILPASSSSAISTTTTLVHDQQQALLKSKNAFNFNSNDYNAEPLVDWWSNNTSANVSNTSSSSFVDHTTSSTDIGMLPSFKGIGNDDYDDMDFDALDHIFDFFEREPNHTAVNTSSMLSSSFQPIFQTTDTPADDHDKLVKTKRPYKPRSTAARSTYTLNDLMKNIIHHLNPLNPKKTTTSSEAPNSIATMRDKMHRFIAEKTEIAQKIADERRNYTKKSSWPLRKRVKIDGHLLNLGHCFLNAGLHEQALQCYNSVYASYHSATPLSYDDIIQSLYELSLLQLPQDKEQACRLCESAYLITEELYDQPEAAPGAIGSLFKMAQEQLNNNDYYPAWENFLTNLSSHREIFSAFAKPSARTADEIVSLQQSAELSQELRQQTLPVVTPCGNHNQVLATYNPKPYQNTVATVSPELLCDSGAPSPIT